MLFHILLISKLGQKSINKTNLLDGENTSKDLVFRTLLEGKCRLLNTFDELFISNIAFGIGNNPIGRSLEVAATAKQKMRINFYFN